MKPSNLSIILITITSILFFFQNLLAQTHITRDTTWTNDQILTQSVIVDPGATLRINGGVNVRPIYLDVDNNGVGDIFIEIRGRLVLRSTGTEHVVFQPYETTNNQSYWTGIIINSSQLNDSLNSFNIYYAHSGLELKSNNVTISDVSINNSRTEGIKIEGVNANLSWVTVDSCSGSGIFNTELASTSIKNSVIRNSALSGIFNLDGSIVIDNSLIFNNHRHGIVNSSGIMTLTYTDITHNAMFGLLLLGTNSSTVSYSTIDSNYSGIQITEFKAMSDSTRFFYEGAHNGVTVNNCNIYNNVTSAEYTDPFDYPNILPDWFLNQPLHTGATNGPFQIPYGRLSAISYRFYGFVAYTSQTGDIGQTASIIDGQGITLQSKSNCACYYVCPTCSWITNYCSVNNEVVQPTTSDKYYQKMSEEVGGNYHNGMPSYIDNNNYVGRVSIKSYGIDNYVNVGPSINCTSNYWGQVINISNVIHNVENPLVNYSGFQLEEISTAHSNLIKPSQIFFANQTNGELLSNRSNILVNWQTIGYIPNVELDFSTDYGNTWNNIIKNIQNNTRSFNWYNRIPAGTNAFIRVIDPTDTSVYDQISFFVTPGNVPLSSNNLLFPENAISDSGSLQLFVRNPLIDSVSISSLSTSTTSFGYHIQLPATIPSNDSVPLLIYFKPNRLGDFTDTLRIDLSDGGSGEVILSGRSPFPTLNPSSTSINYGTVINATTSTINLKVTNSSINTLHIDSIYTGTVRYNSSIGNASVRKQDTLTIPVTFTPNASGLFTDTLFLKNNTLSGLNKIFLTGNGVSPLLSVLVDSVHFNEIALDDSITYALQITNSSAIPLTVTGLTTSIPQFFTSASLPFTITPNGNTSKNIFFKPQSFGLLHDTLKILSNGGNKNVLLIGSSPYPKLVSSNSLLDFGNVKRDSTQLQSFTIRNQSINILRIDSAYNKSSVFDFSQVEGVIQPNDSLIVNIRFTPHNFGSFQDTFYLRNNSVETLSKILLKGSSPIPTITTTPNTLTIGNVAKNTSRTDSIKISNTSMNSLIIDSIYTKTTLFTPNLSNVTVSATNAYIGVTFSPTLAGVFTDTLYLRNNSASTLKKIPLSGICPAPQILVSQTSVIFPNKAIGDSSDVTFYIRNTSISTLTISSLQTFQSVFRTSLNTPAYINGNDSIAVVVKYKPVVYSLVTDTLKIYSDGGTTDVILKGNSPSPQITTKLASINFGESAINDSIIRLFTMYNVSINPLIINSLSNSNLYFSSPSTVPITINGNDSIAIKLKFLTTSFGNFTDTLRVNSNGGSVAIALSGSSPYPIFKSSSKSINFGNVPKGQQVNRTITITNESINELQIDSIKQKNNYFSYSGVPLPFTIVQSETLSLTVFFQPDSVKVYLDSIFIYNNSTEPKVGIRLFGNGMPITAVGDDYNAIPKEFTLKQNFPNPFNPETKIEYAIPSSEYVTLKIYNMLGVEVATLVDELQTAGYKTFTVTLNHLPSGVYLYRLNAGKWFDIKKMILMK